MQIKRTCKVTISLLTFATFDRCGALVSSICSLIVNHAQLAQLNITVVVRNNNPDLASEEFEKLWQGLILKYPSLDFLLFNDGLKRRRGSAMASAGIEINKINFCHKCLFAASPACNSARI